MKQFEKEYLANKAKNAWIDFKDKECYYGRNSEEAIIARVVWMTYDKLCSDFSIEYSFT